MLSKYTVPYLLATERNEPQSQSKITKYPSWLGFGLRFKLNLLNELLSEVLGGTIVHFVYKTIIDFLL